MDLDAHELKAEKELLRELDERNFRAFVWLYRTYGDDLVIFAYGLVGNKESAMETIDSFFDYLWKAGRFSLVEPPLYKYLIYQLRAFCELK